MQKYSFEVCANSVESCLNAQEGGADRVELCAGIPEGGTTPSYGDIITARKYLDTTKLHVIIRPRGGDFLYHELEQEIMLSDIGNAVRAGVDGIVIGCLTMDGNVDTALAERLIAKARETSDKPLSITFHRAFDMCRDPFSALEDIIGLGCDRILTSGCKATAEEGIPLLKELHTAAQGRILLMAGCGVNENNISKIARETGITDFHFSARTIIESGMTYRNDAASMGGTVNIREYERPVTSAARVSDTISHICR